jgi:hypothetical protein
MTYADLSQLLRVLLRILLDDTFNRLGAGTRGRDLWDHLVCARLEFHLAGNRAVLPLVDGPHTGDVVAGDRVDLLEDEVELEVILTLEALEVPVIELTGVRKLECSTSGQGGLMIMYSLASAPQ